MSESTVIPYFFDRELDRVVVERAAVALWFYAGEADSWDEAREYERESYRHAVRTVLESAASDHHAAENRAKWEAARMRDEFVRRTQV